jgi:hypothetical protein
MGTQLVTEIKNVGDVLSFFHSLLSTCNPLEEIADSTSKRFPILLFCSHQHSSSHFHIWPQFGCDLPAALSTHKSIPTDHSSQVLPNLQRQATSSSPFLSHSTFDRLYLLILHISVHLSPTSLQYYLKLPGQTWLHYPNYFLHWFSIVQFIYFGLSLLLTPKIKAPWRQNSMHQSITQYIAIPGTTQTLMNIWWHWVSIGSEYWLWNLSCHLYKVT